MLRSAVNKLLVLAAVAIAAVFIYTDGHKLNNFHGDALGYYMYLPSAVIYNDVVNFCDVPADKLAADHYVRGSLNNILAHGHRTPKGIVINQYTYGVALMEFPFFLAAHAIEKATGGQANGFTDTYQIAIKISSLIYGLLGLLLIYKILKRYYSSTIATVAAVVIFTGSNLFWFTTYQSGMSHVPLFFLYALVMLLTIKLHQQPKTKWFLALGFAAGLITLIRPVDIISLLIPLLYNVYNKQTLRDKISLLTKHWKQVLMIGGIFILLLIPQLMYWKAVSGHYFYYSYGEQTFNWSDPHIFQGVFGAGNGWLIYSPAMIVALPGAFYFRKNINWNLCLWFIIPVYVFVIYCWFVSNYPNGLGSRPMLHMYPLLAIPVAAFFDAVARKKILVKTLVASVVLFFIAVNISYSYQQVRGALISEESTYVYNLGMLFRTKPGYNDFVAWDLNEFQPDVHKVKTIATLGFEGFEDTVSGHYYADVSGKSKYVYHFTDEEYAAKSVKATWPEIAAKGGWLKCSGRFLYPMAAGYYKHAMVITVKHKEETLLWKACRIENKVGITDSNTREGLRLDRQEADKWDTVYFFVKIPAGIQKGDQLELLLWNFPKLQLYADDLKLEVCK